MNSQMKRALEGSQAQELLSPWSWGASPSQCGYVHQPRSSSNPMLLGFYGGFITQALSIINSIFSHSPFSQPSSRNPCRAVSLEQKTVLSPTRLPPRELQGFQKLCVRNRDQRSIVEQEMFLVLLGNAKGFRSSVLGTGGRHIFSIIS